MSNAIDSDNKLIETLISDPEIAKIVADLRNTIVNLSDALTKKLTEIILANTLHNVQIASEQRVDATIGQIAQPQNDTVPPAPEKTIIAEPAPEQNQEAIVSANATQPKQKPRRKTPAYTTINDHALRALYYYRKKVQQPIEPELDAELTRRFAGYDPKTQRFTSKRVHTTDNTNTRESKSVATHQPPKTPAPRPAHRIPLYSRITSIKAERPRYSLFFNNGNGEISVLRTAHAEYDLYLYDELANWAIIRKKQSVLANLYQLFIIDLTNGRVLPCSKKGVKIIRYDTKSHKLFIDKENVSSKIVVSPNRATGTVFHALPTAETLKAQSESKFTVFIDAQGRETSYPLMQIKPIEKYDEMNARVDSIMSSIGKSPNVVPTQTEQKNDAIVAEQTTGQQPVPTKRATTPTPEKNAEQNTNYMMVDVKPGKTTLNGLYNDVYINGKRMFHNHVNTTVKLFCDDTIVAIHGIITDNNNYPQAPIWMVYDTNMKLRIPTQRHAFSKYYIQGKRVAETDNALCIVLSNGANAYLETERMKKLAGPRRFKLEKER